jgi:hypothetical protein
MSMPVAVGLAVLVIAAIAAFWLTTVRGRGPESTASHGDVRPDTDSERFYGGADRPAGPDAEDPPPPVV